MTTGLEAKRGLVPQAGKLILKGWRFLNEPMRPPALALNVPESTDPSDKPDFRIAITGGLILAGGVHLAIADAAVRQAVVDPATAAIMNQWFVPAGLDSAAKTIVDGVRPWVLPTALTVSSVMIAVGLRDQIGSALQRVGRLREGIDGKAAAITGISSFAILGSLSASPYIFNLFIRDPSVVERLSNPNVLTEHPLITAAGLAVCSVGLGVLAGRGFKVK